MRLLLETHIDPAVAAELVRLRPGTEVEIQQRWRGGTLRTASDDQILTAAYEDGYVFVTFDVATIPALVSMRYLAGKASPGVILISSSTLRQNGVAGIARALASACDDFQDDEWAGVVFYLGPGTR